MSLQRPISAVNELHTGTYQIGAQRFDCTQIMTSGKEAVILLLDDSATKASYGLKVIRESYSGSYDDVTEQIVTTELREVPGCTWVTKRTTVTPTHHAPLLRAYPVLQNAVLMPWFHMPTWGEFKLFYANPSVTGFDQYIQNTTPDKINTRLHARALARTLAALEERDLAHRDISDNNVLIDLATGDITLIDFEGLYTAKRQQPQQNVLGSNGYQFHSSLSSTWNRAADRFSGGLLLCEMLCIKELLQTHGSLGDAYFSQNEIDARDTNCANYQTLLTALRQIHTDLSVLFERMWDARTPETCPKLAEWFHAIELLYSPIPQRKSSVNVQGLGTNASQPSGSQSADSNHPGLIIFVLDHSDSMTSPTPDGELRQQKMYAAVQRICQKMADACHKGFIGRSPRYHVALFAYGLDCVNILAETQFTPSAPIAQPVATNPSEGIWTIQQCMDFIDKSGEFNFDHTSSLLKTSTTYMTSTFKKVHTLLARVINDYHDCPPPYIFHITDGSNMDNGDPTLVVRDIRQLETKYGNVLVSNTFIGEPVMHMPSDLKQWPGITDQTRFIPDRAEIGTFLQSISSPIPPQIHAELLKQNYSLVPDAAMLFPGDDHAMLHLAITTCQTTVIQPQFTQLITFLQGAPTQLAVETSTLRTRITATLATAQSVSQLIPALRVSLKDVLRAALPLRNDDIEYDSDAFGSSGELLAPLRDFLRRHRYDRVIQDIYTIQAYTRDIAACEHRVETFVATAAALRPEFHSCLQYLAFGLSSTQPQHVLARVLCSSEPFDDATVFDACSQAPQILPPAALLTFLRERHTQRDEQKLFVHLAETVTDGHTAETSVHPELRACVEAFWELTRDFDITATQTGSFVTTPPHWHWPFEQTTNQHIATRLDLIGPTSLLSNGIAIQYASYPYKASRQYQEESEDSLWFSCTSPDRFFAVLADGASRSALGSIAAEALCSMVYRFWANNPDRTITSSFAHICRLARCEAQSQIAIAFAQLRAMQVEAYILRMLDERNTVGGSQAVFAIVEKHQQTIHCISAGNVRIVIPGHIEPNSALFGSDAARFASLPESGILGQVHVGTYTLTDPAFSINLHSDALEYHTAELVRTGSLDEATLLAAAEADDTTFITFRFPAATH